MSHLEALIGRVPHGERIANLKNTEWDVVILGAGVAGASAAILAARSGFRTLLIDAKTFPREKVCGGCLNQRAQSALQRLGILEKLHHAGAVPITSLHLKIGKTAVVWKIPSLLSVRRSTLDSELVRAAIEAGASVIDGVRGFLIPRKDGKEHSQEPRQVQLQNISNPKGKQVSVIAKCVLIADGLTRSSLRMESGWTCTVESNSRIGVQQMVCASQFDNDSVRSPFLPNQLHMIVSKDGYVGFSHTDGNQVDIAGAIDPKSITQKGSIAAAVRTILAENAGPLSVDHESGMNPQQASQAWLATPALTRSSKRVSCDRVFLLGDSIGYVEPFTGEGMSWAFASAEAIIPLVSRTVGSPWDESLSREWTAWVRSQRRQKQNTCWWISRQLRRISVAAWTLRLCNSIYPIRAALIKKVTS